MKNRALAFKLLSDIRHSYWFVPACLAIFAVILASVLIWIDSHGAPLGNWLPELYLDTQPVGARNTLSVIAQSVIGVTGVMFSVTMVAVSFASGNFGPRLIGNFMRDRGNQWSMGILISTFVYALFVLNAVQDGAAPDTEAFVPHLSLLVATGLALLSVFVMIYFVHHIPETINVSNIAADLGARFCTMLLAQAYNQDEVVPRTVGENAEGVSLGKPGYVQRIDIDRMEDLAHENDLHLHVAAQPGAFVHAGSFALLFDGKLDEDTRDNLRACFALGPSKTEEQNLLFIGEQLVEMMARALSPGVNDPFTAINCLNWCAAGIAEAATEGDCFGVRGRDRVSMAPTDFVTLLEATFGQAHAYAETDKMALAHWRARLDDLSCIGNPRLQDAVDTLRESLA
jgi:uncharacterized membrane protein